jgi:hypothetical protein
MGTHTQQQAEHLVETGTEAKMEMRTKTAYFVANNSAVPATTDKDEKGTKPRKHFMGPSQSTLLARHTRKSNDGEHDLAQQEAATGGAQASTSESTMVRASSTSSGR